MRPPAKHQQYLLDDHTQEGELAHSGACHMSLTWRVDRK